MDEHPKTHLQVRPAAVAAAVGTITFLLLPIVRQAFAADTPSLPPPEAIARPVPPLTLAACIEIGREKQPALNAQRAALAAAEAAERGVNNLHPPKCLAPDLAIRRRQSRLGVSGMEAGLERANQEMVNAVTRTYFQVVYARAQHAVVAELVGALREDLGIAEAIVEAGTSKQVTEREVQKIRVYLGQGEVRLLEIERGIDQSRASLRETMGVGPDSCFEVADTGLPYPSLEICRQQAIDLADARRPELRQADAVVQVTCLEVDAQSVLHGPMGRTFALVSDIHVQSAPHAAAGKYYQPGGVNIEMPPKLVGPRCDRVERARQLSAEAAAAAEKVHGLVVLTAEDAYVRWSNASRALPKARESADNAAAVAREARASFSNLKSDTEKLLSAELLLGQARAKYQEELYDAIVAVADLERFTAGGICLAQAIAK